jgi:GDP-4-dehydro-6-deoxy-D-mannose reductase
MSKKRVVVSGINGFVGHHLTRELVKNNVSVIGVGHEPELQPDIKELVDDYYSQDLASSWPDTGEVDGVIHLAGLAAVGPSFDNPQKYIEINSSIVTNLCEYYQQKERRPRIVIISSGAIYSPDQPMPITEDGEIGYTSPYAVSKVLTENQIMYYRQRGLDCVVARPFNHIGPGQAKGFILPDFYDRISSITDSTIKVGNVNTRRDYTDVRDIAKAYTKMILAPELKSPIYNVCSGKSLSGQEILEILKSKMGRDSISFEIDRSLVRPTDIPEIVGDSSLLQNEINWHPEIDIDQTVNDFVQSKKE